MRSNPAVSNLTGRFHCDHVEQPPPKKALLTQKQQINNQTNVYNVPTSTFLLSKPTSFCYKTTSGVFNVQVCPSNRRGPSAPQHSCCLTSTNTPSSSTSLKWILWISSTFPLPYSRSDFGCYFSTASINLKIKPAELAIVQHCCFNEKKTTTSL